MSKTIPNIASGTPDVKPTAPASQAAIDWALTVALQKTEWRTLTGVVTRLLTLTDPKSGRTFAAAFWACATDDLGADNDSGTFFVNGIDVDELVAQLGKR